MPQLDFSTFPSQIFWLAISFILLYVLLSKICLPTIREVLQNRQSRISGDLKKAESLKEKAKEAETSIQTALDSAKHNANEMIGKARKKALEEETKRHAKLDENINKQHEEAEQRVSQVKKDAEMQLLPVILQATADVYESLTGQKANQKEVEATVKEQL